MNNNKNTTNKFQTLTFILALIVFPIGIAIYLVQVMVLLWITLLIQALIYQVLILVMPSYDLICLGLSAVVAIAACFGIQKLFAKLDKYMNWFYYKSQNRLISSMDGDIDEEVEDNNT